MFHTHIPLLFKKCILKVFLIPSFDVEPGFWDVIHQNYKYTREGSHLPTILDNFFFFLFFSLNTGDSYSLSIRFLIWNLVLLYYSQWRPRKMYDRNSFPIHHHRFSFQEHRHFQNQLLRAWMQRPNPTPTHLPAILRHGDMRNPKLTSLQHDSPVSSFSHTKES